MNIKSYSEMLQYATIEERYRYLRIGGSIGAATFGSGRYLNQAFYQSRMWRSSRDAVIVRDHGCDLGVLGYEIFDMIVIHHMNPITEEDIETLSDFLLNPEFLVCTSGMTHNAIHFGDEGLLPAVPIVRSRNDTSPWLLP